MTSNHAAIMRAANRAGCGEDPIPSTSSDDIIQATIVDDAKSNQSMNSISKISEISLGEPTFKTLLNNNAEINSMESNWRNLGVNFDKLLEHLERANREVTEASIGCLEALSDCVNSTCNQVDVGIKASYKLMATCDSIMENMDKITTFAEDVKNLKKSVETLEILYLSSKQSS